MDRLAPTSDIYFRGIRTCRPECASLTQPSPDALPTEHIGWYHSILCAVDSQRTSPMFHMQSAPTHTHSKRGWAGSQYLPQFTT